MIRQSANEARAPRYAAFAFFALLLATPHVDTLGQQSSPDGPAKAAAPSGVRKTARARTKKRTTRSTVATAAARRRARARRAAAARRRQSAATAIASNSLTKRNTINASAVTPASTAASAAPAPAPLPSTMPLPPSVDPFAAIESESSAGNTFNISFSRTELVKKAAATAQVSLRGQTLLVRINAKDLPPPSTFDVPRYALWVYVPNYQVKMYIGDLPITLKSGADASTYNPAASKKGRGAPLGKSISAYRYTVLPPGAEFGGLMLTAEPIRYTPIVNEALRPVLVSLTPQVNPQAAVAAPTVYAGPLPQEILDKKLPAAPSTQNK